MLDTSEQPYVQPLAAGLVLRTAANADDVERVAKFNGGIHGPGLVPMTRNLFLHHPNTTGRDLVFVEDTTSGAILSSLCLIPWLWSVSGVAVLSGELGIVGTLPEQRRRGLVRLQMEFFKQRLRERGCLLSHIQGIPYYYRQFGYQYALPLDGNLRLEWRDVPQPGSAPQAEDVTFRLATAADIPVLCHLYDEAAAPLAIYARRTPAVWRYLCERTAGGETESETWLALAPTGQAVGYMVWPRYHFGAEPMVNDVSRLSFAAALAALRHCKLLGQERKLPGLRLNLPAQSTLFRLAASLGGQDRGSYALQMYIPDVAGLLRALAPAFAQRLAASPFAAFSGEVRLGAYRDSYAMHFAGGNLEEVAKAGFGEHEAIAFPPQALAPLLLGDRSASELHEAYPDAIVRPGWRLLVDTLFPRLPAFINTIY